MTNHAILIANGQYPEYPSLPPLVTPTEDVRRLKALLEHEGRGKFNVMSLENKSTQEILDELTWLLKDEAKRDDLVLIYYSGHGLLDDNLRLSLAAFDTDDTSEHRRVFFGQISKLVERSKARRFIIILDCCNSASAGKSFEAKGVADLSQEFTGQLSFLECTETSLKSMAAVGALEMKSEEEGVFLMTASSAAEPAWGNKEEGGSEFTRHIIKGIEGAAMMRRPGDDESLYGVVTVNSLFQYAFKGVQDSGIPQTPRLFTRGSKGDMVVVPITMLDGDYRNSAFMIWRETPVLENLVPTYILDDKFRFLHWNSGFQRVVAGPKMLRRGSHVETFLKQLENWDSEVRTKSVKDFPLDAPERHPRVHCERMVLRTDLYGLVEFRKIASKLRDGSGCWCVMLNVVYVENSDRFWRLLEAAMEQDETWAKYAECYDPIIGEFEKNKELVHMVVSLVGEARECLDIGAGTGNTTFHLLETSSQRHVHAVDISYPMLARMNEKLQEFPTYKGRIEITHCDCVTALSSVKDETYDACTMMNVLFAIDDPESCLREIRRVLKYDGVLSLSTSHSLTDIETLFREIEDELRQKGEWEEKRDQFENARLRNRELVSTIRRYSEADTEQFLRNAGFDEIQCHGRGMYVGCVFVVTARKRKKEYVVSPDAKP